MLVLARHFGTRTLAGACSVKKATRSVAAEHRTRIPDVVHEKNDELLKLRE